MWIRLFGDEISENSRFHRNKYIHIQLHSLFLNGLSGLSFSSNHINATDKNRIVSRHSTDRPICQSSVEQRYSDHSIAAYTIIYAYIIQAAHVLIAVFFVRLFSIPAENIRSSFLTEPAGCFRNLKGRLYANDDHVFLQTNKLIL